MDDTLAYPVHLQPDDNDTVLVTFPDFPEAHTYGETDAEALMRAGDALATALDEYMRKDRDIPRPSEGVDYVPVPALTAAKLQLYKAMRRQDVTKAELARRLGWHKPQVDRLFKVFHHSRLDQLEQAFRVLGMRLVVTAEDEISFKQRPLRSDIPKDVLVRSGAGRRRKVLEHDFDVNN